MGLRVAVLGASGFGRHHAKWYATLGCDVVAFLGSSPRSVEATRAALAEAFGFRGAGYTSLDELLAKESPDALSVCTPWALHGEQTRAAIEAGCSVLCEKPFVWRAGVPAAALVDEARSLCRAAAERGVALSVNTQYVAAGVAYRAFMPRALAAPASFTGVMTSRLKPRGPRGRDIWLDLAPHPLSILLELLPEARLVAGTVAGAVAEESTRVNFALDAGGRACRAALYVAKLRQAPFERRFGLGDLLVECGTAPDADGVYHGTLRRGGLEHVCDDFMRTSIARFCAAVRGEGAPLTSAAAAVRNLELTLAVLDELERPTVEA